VVRCRGGVEADNGNCGGDGFSAIPIIDLDRLAIALELFKAGLEERFFQFLANPLLSPLRSPSEEVY
jgi:hypothetical protein